MTAREAALFILERCRKDGAWFSAAADKTIRSSLPDSRDAALASAIALGVLQNRAYFDFLISCFCSTPPEKLEKIADELRKEIEETGIEVTDIVGLPRARKIQARLGARTAEVSIFQGKDSFTVVFSPRSGTDGELNRLLADMVKNFLSNMD